MRACVIVILFLPFCATAQDNDSRFSYYFTLYAQADGKLAPPIEPVMEYIGKLEQKRSSFKTQKAFLYFLFTRTNQHFLRSYTEHATFHQMISHGAYNCLSGTALYALLLRHFKIEFRIIETNYHIYILADTEQGKVLLESTDGETGFVDRPGAISERMNSYAETQIRRAENAHHYFNYSRSHVDTVSLTGILGLLHYNEAVEAYNRQDYRLAIARLRHAFLLHRSPRLEEFLQLLVTTIKLDEEIDDSVRDQYLTSLANLRSTRKQQIATLMIPLIR